MCLCVWEIVLIFENSEKNLNFISKSVHFYILFSCYPFYLALPNIHYILCISFKIIIVKINNSYIIFTTKANAQLSCVFFLSYFKAFSNSLKNIILNQWRDRRGHMPLKFLTIKIF